MRQFDRQAIREDDRGARDLAPVRVYLHAAICCGPKGFAETRVRSLVGRERLGIRPLDHEDDRGTVALAGRLQQAAHVFPASVGWRNTLGSVAGALLLIQLLTGFLLALYYVPHPGAAHETVRYVEEEVRGGALVRALHYWGASFIMIALFIHVVRVFLAGAYKKPREMNWLIGLALLGAVIGLAFTGQLLPWNQAGY